MKADCQCACEIAAYLFMLIDLFHDWLSKFALVSMNVF